MNNGNGHSRHEADRSCSNHSNSSTSSEDCSSNLIVNYLPQTTSQDEVCMLFSAFGPVESCKLIRDKPTGQSLGYAFVKYENAAHAEKAVHTLNGLRLQNKVIKVSYARPSSETIKGANLYVSGLPRFMSQIEFENIFAQFGRIITSRILSETVPFEDIDRARLASIPPISKGVGFIRFDQRSEAEKAINAMNGKVLKGSKEPMVVKFANNPATNAKPLPALATYIAPSAAIGRIANAMNSDSRLRYLPLLPMTTTTKNIFTPTKGLSLTPSSAIELLSDQTASKLSCLPGTGWTLFVYNLAPETEENLLWQLFGPFGAVQTVKIMRDLGSGKCKGYGFVTMTNYEEAVRAIQMINGFALGDRVLQVSFKTSKRGK